MTNEQLIEKFNPANGANLSAEDLLVLRQLNDEQIGILAKAYPNTPNRRAYIRLFDNQIKPEKQLYQLSTWQNLNNLRKFSGKKNLVPFDFQTPGSKVNALKTTPAKANSAPKRVVVDLSAQEAANELTASIQKAKAEKTTAKVVDKESFKEKMAKGKAAKEAAKAAAPETKTEIPADQDFDAAIE